MIMSLAVARLTASLFPAAKKYYNLKIGKLGWEMLWEILFWTSTALYYYFIFTLCTTQLNKVKKNQRIQECQDVVTQLRQP